MESLQPTATSQLAKDNYRCIQPGLGSSLQRGDHWVTLVTNRGLLPHKLPKDASSIPSSSVFHKWLSSSPHSLSLHGQHDSNLLPEPQRRDDLPLTLHVSQTNLAVVHAPEHFTSGQSPTWTSEHSHRQGVQGITGQMGLATPAQNLLQNQSDMGTSDNRSMRLTHQLPAYFSWRPDPQALATDVFLQDWSGKICYGNPPWGLM